MRIRFLVDEKGENGTIKWKYRKGEVIDAEMLPSGEASAWRWVDLNVAEILPEPAASPKETSVGLASPAGDASPPDAEEASPLPRRRGRPPKAAEAAA